jgi:hypothetical protein
MIDFRGCALRVLMLFRLSERHSVSVPWERQTRHADAVPLADSIPK